MNRLLKISTAIIMGVFLIGCAKTKVAVTETVTESGFDYDKGQKIADQYIENLSKGQFQLLKDISTMELNSNNKELVEKGEKIVSYKKIDTKETGKGVLYTYKVNRCKEGSGRADLDNFTVSVEKSPEGYFVSKVESSTEMEVSTKGPALRIKYKDEVQNYLLIGLSNLPKEIYPKINKAPIYKELVPVQEFGTINLGYEGKKIAITSKEENRTYVAVVELDSEEKNSSVAPVTGGQTQKVEDLGLFEKPIGKKIVSLDLLYDKTVDKIIFTKSEEAVVVQYSEANKGSGVNIYKSVSGDLLDIKFDDMFPKDKYNVLMDKLNERDVYIKVTAREGVSGIRQDVLGEYSVNLKDLNILKL